MKHHFMLFVLFLVALGFAPPFTHTCFATSHTITIGSISDNPREEILAFQPVIDYLRKRLGHHGITQGEVKVVDTMKKMIDLLKDKKVDLFIDSPFPALYICKKSDAEPLLRRWKKGVEKYHSIIFVKKDSNIKGIEDLKGKMIAFEEPFSTSGYFLPKAAILKMGYELDEKRNFKQKVGSGIIGYTFSYDDKNTLLWVKKNKTHAGSMSNTAFLKQAGDFQSNYRILLGTIDVPRHIVCHRAGIPSTVVSDIVSILVGMENDMEGKQVLNGFSHTTRFDIPSQGLSHYLKPVIQLLEVLEDDFSQQ